MQRWKPARHRCLNAHQDHETVVLRGQLVRAVLLGLCMASVTSAQLPGEAMLLDSIVPQFHPDFEVGQFSKLMGSATALGDLDGDGNLDFAFTNDGSLVPEIWLMDVRLDTSVETVRRIDGAEGGFESTISIASLGDLDGDGVPDLAVGAARDSSVAASQGSVRILFLRADGSVKASSEISTVSGGFGGTLEAFDFFGGSMVALGDFDGDGVPDLAVGAPGPVADTAGCPATSTPGGSVWLLMLNPDGTVKSEREIDAASVPGLFLSPCGQFGSALASDRDPDGDGVHELAVGAVGDGALWLLDVTPTAGVIGMRQITMGELGISPATQFFPSSIAFLDDLNHDGVRDLAVSATNYQPLAVGFGEVHILFRALDGSVEQSLRIKNGKGGETSGLQYSRTFGTVLLPGGDWNGDGVVDLIVGSTPTYVCIDPACLTPGFLTVLFLSDGVVRPARSQVFSSSGLALDVMSDLDGDGGAELVIGRPNVIGGRGDVRIQYYSPEGYWRSSVSHSLIGTDNSIAGFGSAVATLDLDGAGGPDLAVGAPLDKPSSTGAVWILFLNPDGSLDKLQKIDDIQGALPGPIVKGDRFGAALAALPDLDGDGIKDLAVGAPGSGGTSTGHVWVLLMRPNGFVKSGQRIDGTTGGFQGELDLDDLFGAALANLGDLDGDGLIELAVGAPKDDDGGLNRGAVWVLSLAADGKVVRTRKLSQTSGGFHGTLADRDRFGSAIALGRGIAFGDGGLLAVGARGDDRADPDAGATWLFTLGTHAGGPLFTGRERLLHPGSPVILDALPKPTWGPGAFFGTALTWFKDRDGDGNDELVIGVPHTGPGAVGSASYWFGSPLGSPWTDFGGGLPGSTGTPRLFGLGALLPGDEVRLALSNAPANTLAFLVAGTATVNTPFHGGVLIPRPDRLIGGLLTDGQGMVTLVSPWPNLPPAGTHYFFQMWMLDAQAPAGMAASNAVAALFP